MKRVTSEDRLSPAEKRRVKAITAPLARWFTKRARKLPWRADRDPYRVWISEIMLQQTQVKTVIPYYERFLDRFPTVDDLASADTDTVLEYWAGLGYYSRGRNLHRAAQLVVAEHSGRFPDENKGLRALPGVGEYTAAAIGSIVLDHAVPVIDGNVERVLARFLALSGDPKRGESNRRLRAAAELAIPEKNPGDHNQAVMELGATVCSPRSPSCGECPIANGCEANRLQRQEEFPPPRKRRAPEQQRWVAAVVEGPTVDGEPTIWVSRSPDRVPFLRGHWAVPLLSVDGPEAPTGHDEAINALKEQLAEELDLLATRGEPAGYVRHSITYRRLEIQAYRFGTRRRTPGAEGKFLPRSEIGTLAALYRKIVTAE
ncbi:MAG: A/G-specific adenine glycosylase [Planctomycetota bacterium]